MKTTSKPTKLQKLALCGAIATKNPNGLRTVADKTKPSGFAIVTYRGVL